MVSGLHLDAPSDVVRAKLFEVKDDLLEGLLQFKASTSESGTQLEKLLKDARQEKLLPLTKHLQKYLSLDAEQTWATLCSYLVNDYKGSPGSLATYVLSDGNRSKLLADIWNYYSLERMIILKLTKNLLEFRGEKRHPYHVVYAEVVEQIGVQSLKSKLFDQLTAALKEDPDCHPQFSTLDHREHDASKMAMLLERKLREINELLHLLTLIVQHEETAVPDELRLLLNIFKNSSFLQKCKYNTSGEPINLLQKIEHSRVILMLIYIQHCPSDVKSWEPTVFNDVDVAIVSAPQFVENAPLFLAWMIKNCKVAEAEESLGDSTSSRNYQHCGSMALKLEVFKYLLGILQAKTYQSKPPSLIASTARRTIYATLNDLCDRFDSDGSVAQHSCIYDLLAELLTTPAIAADLVKLYNSEDGQGCASLFNTAVELFPAEFVPISQIASALASSGAKASIEFVRYNGNYNAVPQLTQLPRFIFLAGGATGDTARLH